MCTGVTMGIHWRPSWQHRRPYGNALEAPWYQQSYGYTLESLSVFTVGPFGSSGGPMCMHSRRYE